MTFKKLTFKFIALVFIFAIFNLIFLMRPVNAATNYQKIASYNLKPKWWTQGATITKNYFIYTESQLEKHVGNNPSTILVRCSRPSFKNCKKTKSYKWGHILTLSHKWGTNYILVRSDYGKNAGCWNISQFTKSSMDNCSWKDNGSPRHYMKTYGGRNGYANQGKYYLRVFGTGNTKNLHIVLYDSSQKVNGQYKILRDIKMPTSMHELEDIMVDHDTGNVYFTAVHAGKNRGFYLFKLNDSIINNYIKGAKSTPSNSPINSKPNSSSNNSGPSPSSSGNNSSSNTNFNSSSSSSYNGTVDTTFFGEIKDDGSGCGVFTILNTVVDILSIGVGVLGVIAISISGIQYLTSAGNEEQARKSRHRIFQIIIGLAVYAIMYTGINWLTPSGKLNTGSECKVANNYSITKIL